MDGDRVSAAATAVELGDDRWPGHRRGEGLTPGNGVTWPRLVREVKPNYTPDAMRAQVEGMVELEILVLADGSVGRVNIVRSLDARFGLDQEAINAVRRWRFDPGRRSGKAVATRVGVELSFNLAVSSWSRRELANRLESASLEPPRASPNASNPLNPEPNRTSNLTQNLMLPYSA